MSLPIDRIKIVECSRDAMQGIHHFIPTHQKIAYLQKVMQVGFDVIDIGSFVSPRYIPQMADTQEVLTALQDIPSPSLWSVIVANTRGAMEAVAFERIRYIGYPFSISPTFQMRNTNTQMTDALDTVAAIHDICQDHQKVFVAYVSMAFGNPYGDPWSPEIALDYTQKLIALGIQSICLSDTVGVAKAETIRTLFETLVPEYPHIEWGAHLHTVYDQWYDKIDAAYTSGCVRFDGAIRGLGGCPMANDELVGNMPTEHLISFFKEKNKLPTLSIPHFQEVLPWVHPTFDPIAKA